MATGRDVPGGELAREFFARMVEPTLSLGVPRLRYAAGRLGSALLLVGRTAGIEHIDDREDFLV